MNIDRLRASLRDHEGFRAKPYRDTVGVLTIGYGRNLEAVGLSKDEADYLLNNDLMRAWQGAMNVVPTFAKLTDARQEVLVEMVFNLGVSKFSNFKKTLAFIDELDWDSAASEMLDSRWAEQVGTRAQRLSQKFRMG